MTTYAINNLIGAPVIHRTDWQGRQLLYPTPRTNYFLYSNNLTAGSWVNRGCTATYYTTGGPGGSDYSSITNLSTSSGGSIYNIIPCGTNPDGTPVGAAVMVRSATATGTVNIQNPENNLNGAWILDLSKLTVNEWNRVDANSPAVTVITPFSTNTNNAGLFFFADTIPTSVILDIAFCFTQIGVAGAVFENATNAPVTLTDYTLAGTTVNLGQVPATGAILDWSGTGTYVS